MEVDTSLLSFSSPVPLMSTQSSSVAGPPCSESITETIVTVLGRQCHNFQSLDTEPCFTACCPEVQLNIPDEACPPQIKTGRTHGVQRSWLLNYTVVSFLMNGQLFGEYNRLAHMLGLPPCSDTHWQRIVRWLEVHVSQLAEWSCGQVREMVRQREDHTQWIASYDGYYLTRGHYSNNSSATLHDHSTGKVAWFKHRTKRGLGHNLEGTTGAAEADMFQEILSEVRRSGFVIKEIVTDKDSSMNAIYCQHFPEGTVTYCSNHSAKTFHKDLSQVRQTKCQVSHTYYNNNVK